MSGVMEVYPSQNQRQGSMSQIMLTLNLLPVYDDLKSKILGTIVVFTDMEERYRHLTK
jgi:hypothetical protein